MPNLTTSYIPLDQRDPLHELEMARAYLAQARLQNPLKPHPRPRPGERG